MICHRCKKETYAYITSMFNLDVICLECKKKEEDHPDYENAKKAELEQCRQGNFNFEGIGKPVDL